MDVFPPVIDRRATVPARCPAGSPEQRSLEESEGDVMFTDQNKTNARRIVDESWNKHNTKVLDELFASDAPLHDPQNPNTLRGPQGAKSTLETYLTAFPDLKITIEKE